MTAIAEVVQHAIKKLRYEEEIAKAELGTAESIVLGCKQEVENIQSRIRELESEGQKLGIPLEPMEVIQ